MITKQRPNVTPQSSGPNREKQKHTETTRQRAMWMTRQTFFLSHCCDVTVSESVICKTQQQTQLASTRITNQDQFKEVVIITFKSHPGACVHATSKRKQTVANSAPGNPHSDTVIPATSDKSEWFTSVFCFPFFHVSLFFHLFIFPFLYFFIFSCVHFFIFYLFHFIIFSIFNF